jgi:hypothetical protein
VADAEMCANDHILILGGVVVGTFPGRVGERVPFWSVKDERVRVRVQT